MASIGKYRVKNGHNGIKWYLYYRVGTKQKMERGFATRGAAEERRKEVEGAVTTGEWVDPQKAKTMTFDDLFERWSGTKKGSIKQGSLAKAQNTYVRYVQSVLGTKRIAALTNSDIQRLINSLRNQYSASTTQAVYGTIKGPVEQAELDGIISPANARKLLLGISLPKRDRHGKAPDHRHYLTISQLLSLADSVAPEYQALVLVLGLTGLRIGEARALTPSDIDLLTRTVNVNKAITHVQGGDPTVTDLGPRETKHWAELMTFLPPSYVLGTPKTQRAKRRFKFPAALVPVLAKATEGKGSTEPIFTSPQDGLVVREVKNTPEDEWDSATSASWWTAGLRKAQLPRMTLHDLRHTAASLAIHAGASVKMVQTMLGHESAQVTLDVYADLFDEEQDTVADAIDAQIERVRTDPSMVTLA